MPNIARDDDDILLSKSDPSFTPGLHFSPFQQLGVYLFLCIFTIHTANPLLFHLL